MLKVKDIMTHPVFSLKENDTLFNAKSMMDLQRIRHIPITTVDNVFTGLITHRDILSVTISQLAELDEETQRDIDSSIPIKEIMRTDVATTTGDMLVKEAAQILLNHKYGCLPVVEQSNLVGIITEADFLRLTINLMDALED